jgi:hypothetical protein
MRNQTPSLWLWLCVGLAACGSDDKPGADHGAAGAAGNAANMSGTGGVGGVTGSGGSLAAGTGGGPAIGTDLENNRWAAPGANCGTAGQRCDDGCDANTICDSFESELCLPSPSAAVSLICSPGACESSQPYCIAGQCMTAEQASCTCARPAALERLQVCRSGPDAARGTCLGEEAICAGAPDNCCDGLICLQVPGIIAQCWMPCVENAECSSGCCTAVATGQKICAPAESCGLGTDAGVGQRCAQTGESCETDPCCGAMSCFQSDNPDFAGCHATCTSAADCESHCCWPAGDSGSCVGADYCGTACASPTDCETNCCVVGLPGEAGGRCAPAKACSSAMCLQAAAACGGDLGLCCEGLICTAPAGSSAACSPRCTTSTECASGCCAPITGTDDKACNPTGPAC